MLTGTPLESVCVGGGEEKVKREGWREEVEKEKSDGRVKAGGVQRGEEKKEAGE